MSIAEFAIQVNKLTKKALVFQRCIVSDKSHAPTITIQLDLPGGFSYVGSGKNTKIAKVDAIDKALNDNCFNKMFLLNNKLEDKIIE